MRSPSSQPLFWAAQQGWALPASALKLGAGLEAHVPVTVPTFSPHHNLLCCMVSPLLYPESMWLEILVLTLPS